MSHILKYYVADVLEEVCTRMGNVSENVFPETRPSATQRQMQDFVVVSLPVEIENQNAWQRGVLRIELYVRTRSNGVSNTGKLQELLDAVTAEFPIVTKRFSATAPRLVLKGSDKLGFTVWNIQSKLIINTTDSYETSNNN